MKKNLCLFTLFLSLISASVQAGPLAFVTITPQKYFVDKVSGGEIPVSIMVEPGANPHAYEPRPRQMAELATASIYFTIGDSFDQTWLERITSASPGMTVVHTAEGITKIPMKEEHSHGEEHAGDGHKGETHDAHEVRGPDHDDHDQGTLDPHIWLDPALVKIQVASIREGLSTVDPERADLYAANARAFEKELDTLDLEIRSILQPLPQEKRTFLVFHPSWGYFAKAYGLTQASIEVDGKEPSPRDLARIIAAGKESGAKVVFVQPQFSEKSAAVIAKQIGAKIVRLDPLAADWAENLRSAARAFAGALE
jgi:zinc transport system substrate-binding protein